MGYALLPYTIPDQHRSFHGFLPCKLVPHVEPKAFRPCFCFTSVVESLAQPKGKQAELEREIWLSQIRGYVRQGKAFEAEELMRKMQDEGLVPDLLCYNALITAHGKADRFTSAHAWFCLLESDAWVKPDAVSYRSMIGACGRAGELEIALMLYRKMTECGFSPSGKNFHTLISLHRTVDMDTDKEDQVLGILADMRETGCCPDSSTVDVIVRLYERWGVVKNLSNAISFLKAAGWNPTQRCYCIFLKAYIRFSLADEALKAYHELCTMTPHLQSGKTLVGHEECSDKGRRMCGDDSTQSLCNYKSSATVFGGVSILDESVFHRLICVCRTAGLCTEALQVYDDMRQVGIKPSWFTACTVIDICGRVNEITTVAKAEALFAEMRSSAEGRETTDAGAYTVTINMFLKAGLFDKAAEISSLAVEHAGLASDSALYLAMLRAYSRCGMPAKGVQIYKRMLGVRLTWTAPMFNGVLHCCGRALPLEESIKIFLAMVYAHAPLTNTTCNLMMDIFGKAGLLDKAENVFKLAKDQGVLDAISYNTIIAAYGRFKEYKRMEHAFLEMQNAGFRDNAEAYNSMLDAYGKAGQLSRMYTILAWMIKSSCLPDLSTFNILINVYGREGLIGELRKVRKSMEEANIQPDSYTLNTLIFAYGNAKLPDEAMGAFKEMHDLDLLPDEVTYNCLISAFEKSGNLLEAARWSLWMTQLGMK